MGSELPEYIFYDGECGLCHSFVRYVLRFQPGAEGFRFAPLQSKACKRLLTTSQNIPAETVVVLTADHQVLTKSESVAHVLQKLGPFNQFLARVLASIPRGLADWGYDRVASIRKKVFKTPQTLCPIIPAEIRERFLDE